MTFTTNSMTSANPAADLYTALASALSSAGFTLEDTVTISTRTHKVWKSAAAGNAQGLDWYLDVAYTTTGAGSVWLGAFEGYTAASDVGLRGPYNSSSDTTTPEGTYFSRYGASTSALETNWTHISNNVAQIQTQTSAYAYWASVTTDRVIVMTSVQPTHILYCGFFDMYTPWANKISTNAYPLISCTVNSPTTTNSGQHNNVSNMPTPPANTSVAPPAALTRRPPVATILDANTYRYAGVAILSTSSENSNGSLAATGGAGYGAPTNYVDSGTFLFHDAPRGGALGIVASFDGANRGISLGTLKDLNVFGALAVTRGDTVSISGTDWVLSSTVAGGAGGRCYGFKAI